MSRYIKNRTLGKGAVDLALERNHNPLRRSVAIPNPTHETTTRFLQQFKEPLNASRARKEPYVMHACRGILKLIPPLRTLCEKSSSGWLAWGSSHDVFLLPDETQTPFPPWDPENQESMSVIQEFANDPVFWKQLSKHFSAENHAEVITQDHASCVKSICELHE